MNPENVFCWFRTLQRSFFHWVPQFEFFTKYIFHGVSPKRIGHIDNSFLRTFYMPFSIFYFFFPSPNKYFHVTLLNAIILFYLKRQLAQTRTANAKTGLEGDFVKANTNNSWRTIARKAATNAVEGVAGTAEAEMVEVETAEAVAAAAQASVDINLARELSAAQRPLKELGRGKHRYDQLLVFLSAEERWFILDGLSLPLTALPANQREVFGSGEQTRCNTLIWWCQIKSHFQGIESFNLSPLSFCKVALLKSASLLQEPQPSLISGPSPFWAKFPDKDKKLWKLKLPRARGTRSTGSTSRSIGITPVFNKSRFLNLNFKFKF